MENADHVPPMPDSFFANTSNEIKKLRDSLAQGANPGIYSEPCMLILHSLEKLKDELERTSAYSLDRVTAILSYMREEVHGDVPLKQIQDSVTKEMIKATCFPFYQNVRKVRGYQVTRCVNHAMASLIYPQFLIAHGLYPNND